MKLVVHFPHILVMNKQSVYIYVISHGVLFMYITVESRSNVRSRVFFISINWK